LQRRQFGWLTIAATYTLILLVTWIATDVVGYIFLPMRFALQIPEYRATGFEQIPRYYIQKNAIRGFDLAENASGFFSVDGNVFPIFSNSLGCFDKNGPDAFKHDYTYFAGDSFTWGFAAYEAKFATRFEQMTGVPVAKCGVYGTGTLHQFDKFLAVAQAIGHLPTTVVVGFHDNDLQDDYAYPDWTVIDGWGVATVYVEHPNTLKLHRPDIRLLEDEVVRMNPEADSRSAWRLTKNAVKRYSLTANVASLAMRKVTSLRPAQDIGPKLGFTIYQLSEDGDLEPPRNPKFKYGDTAMVMPNKRALAAWKDHAVENNYRLVVMMIPPRLFFDQTDRYVEFKRFLDLHQVEHIDLTHEFRARRLSSSDLYWEGDFHLKNEGNKVVGEILSSRLMSRFGGNRVPESGRNVDQPN